MRFLIPLAALLAMLGASPAIACTLAPGPARLPGESDADYSARDLAFFQHGQAEDQRSRQIALFDTAARVSLATIVTRSKVPHGSGGSERNGLSQTEVKPLVSLKGPIGNANVILREQLVTSCGIVGDGTAARAKSGTYVILFELPGRDVAPGGYGILLNEIRDDRIWAALGVAADRLSTPAR